MSRWRGLREDQRAGEGLVEMLLATLHVPLNLCRSQLVGEAGAAICPQDVSRTSSLLQMPAFDQHERLLKPAAGSGSSMGAG
jgi:hypothetical protein